MARRVHRHRIKSRSSRRNVACYHDPLPDVPDHLVERARRDLTDASPRAEEAVDRLIDEVFVDLIEALHLSHGGGR